MKKLLLSTIVIIVSLLLVLTGCGSDETTPVTSTTTTKTTATTQTTTSTASQTTATTTTATTTPSNSEDMYGGIYHYGLSVAPGTPLGYPVESAPDAGLIAGLALERLLLVGDGGIAYPRLAESWDIDVAGNTMTFHLRQGVKFTDGSDLNAEVVKWNLDLYMEAGKATNWSAVDIVDDHTVKVTVKGYQNTALSGASGYMIASKAAFDKHGIDWARENPVGTGPFIFVEHERGSRVYFEKNPDYWEAGKPYLDGVEFVVITDPTVRSLAFKRGDTDGMLASGLDAQELLELGFPYVQRTGGTYVLIPDSANPDSPMSDLKVRQAISYAIDRESLATNLGFGFLRPAYQLYPGFEATAIPGFQGEQFNPEKAKQLLTEAGYPDGFQTTIHAFTRVVKNEYILAIAAMLDEVGIQTTPDFPEAGKYTEYRFGSWQNAMMGHGFAQWDNFNSAWDFYFGPTQFKSAIRPAEYIAAKDASLAAPESDPVLVQKVIQTLHDYQMLIPYVEEVITYFERPGAHDEGAKMAPQTQFWSHLAWLEPDAR